MNEKKEFISILTAAINSYPHLRIGQLLVNALATMDDINKPIETLYYASDQNLIESLKVYLKLGGPKHE